ncbi:UNKNOWN [Stylonychia lemnae]|uniref:Uncharacterized protein n=1 Tax=Stylonychia lemnae TaxID=5949 RepID=A0A078AIL0_STYLE|nr:UNKNOWN [Stylonychia lemnae]|eukprot:CDW82095.1 UNKNOWN [Stylonychia lemnae]
MNGKIPVFGYPMINFSPKQNHQQFWKIIGSSITKKEQRQFQINDMVNQFRAAQDSESKLYRDFAKGRDLSQRQIKSAYIEEDFKQEDRSSSQKKQRKKQKLTNAHQRYHSSNYVSNYNQNLGQKIEKDDSDEDFSNNFLQAGHARQIGRKNTSDVRQQFDSFINEKNKQKKQELPIRVNKTQKLRLKLSEVKSKLKLQEESKNRQQSLLLRKMSTKASTQMGHSHQNYAVNINTNNDINYVMIGSQISEVNQDELREEVNQTETTQTGRVQNEYEDYQISQSRQLKFSPKIYHSHKNSFNDKRKQKIQYSQQHSMIMPDSENLEMPQLTNKMQSQVTQESIGILEVDHKIQFQTQNNQIQSRAYSNITIDKPRTHKCTVKSDYINQRYSSLSKLQNNHSTNHKGVVLNELHRKIKEREQSVIELANSSFYQNISQENISLPKVKNSKGIVSSIRLNKQLKQKNTKKILDYLIYQCKREITDLSFQVVKRQGKKKQ